MKVRGLFLKETKMDILSRKEEKSKRLEDTEGEKGGGEEWQ